MSLTGASRVVWIISA